MKYSEAIRLGSMLYPQCCGRLISGADGQVSVCANGAAALALGMSTDELRKFGGFLLCPQKIFDLAERVTGFCVCPIRSCRYSDRTIAVCSHLNDSHVWTRERIADWLAASGHDFEIDLAAKPECAPAAEPVAAGVAE